MTFNSHSAPGSWGYSTAVSVPGFLVPASTLAFQCRGPCRCARSATRKASSPSMRRDLTVYPLNTLFSYMQANRRPHDWQGTPMPWDVFELGLHCWRAAWPHLALSKGTPADARPGGNIWAWPGRGSSRAGAGQKAHVHQRYTKHTLQTKVMRPF